MKMAWCRPWRAMGSGPEPSAAHFPCRSKAQELRASMSSNSLRFLTPGRANGLYRLWVPMGPNPSPTGGSAVDNLRRHFLVTVMRQIWSLALTCLTKLTILTKLEMSLLITSLFSYFRHHSDLYDVCWLSQLTISCVNEIELTAMSPIWILQKNLPTTKYERGVLIFSSFI